MTKRQITASIPALLVCTAVLVTFAPALQCDFVNWDDDLNLTNNPSYRGFTAAHLRWMFTTTLGGHYHPLTWLSYAIDYALYGMTPAGYHATSLLLHAANAVLVLLVLQRLLRPLAIADESTLRSAALVGALFFGIHPLRVESVVWLSERRDVLAGFFWLLALLAYLSAVQGEDRHRYRRLAAALLGLVLSLLSKAWGMTFPLVLLILDAYPLRRLQPNVAAVLREKIPFALVAAAGAVASFLAQQPAGMSSLSQHGIGSRLAQSAYGLCFYLAKTVWPVRLQPLYLIEVDFDPANPRYVSAMVIVLAITMLAVASRRHRPWFLATWAAYVVIVSPVLGIAQTGFQLVADRYTYLATLPLTALLTAGFTRVVRLKGRATANGLASAALAALGVLTFQQIGVWHDSISLWDHALALDPNNYIAYNNRGWARGVSEDAVSDYTAAIRLNPSDFVAYFNRGNIRNKLGDARGAMADYNAAINLAPTDPYVYNSRGWLREQQGDRRGAIADYTRARDLAPAGSGIREVAEKNIAAVEPHAQGTGE